MSEMVSCPYNAAHRFIADKFMFHVMRCKDGKKLRFSFSRCPYNTMHYIRNPEFEQHCQVCPDRLVTEKIQQLFEGSAGREFGGIGFEDTLSRNRSRSRSRGRNKKEEQSLSSTSSLTLNLGKVDLRKQPEVQVINEEEHDVLFDDCKECRKLISEYVGECGYDTTSPVIAALKSILRMDDD